MKRRRVFLFKVAIVVVLCFRLRLLDHIVFCTFYSLLRKGYHYSYKKLLKHLKKECDMKKSEVRRILAWRPSWWKYISISFIRIIYLHHIFHLVNFDYGCHNCGVILSSPSSGSYSFLCIVTHSELIL